MRHIKYKDLIFRRIADVQEGEDLVLVNMTDSRTCGYLVEPFIQGMESLAPLKNHECCFLICYNTKENLNFLIKNWEVLVKFKRNFCIMFINPFSKTEKKWAIYPATHDLITERSALKLGLEVLFSTVDALTEQEVSKVIEK